MAQRYLVTGANGFVGRVLCARLQDDGHRVRALLRRPADGPWHEQVCCELGREPVPAAACADTAGVFHLAGLAHMQDASGIPDAVYQRANVEGTGAVLAAAQAAGVGRLVYLSSVKAAADPGEDCVDEDWDAPPADAYGCSKRAAEHLVLAAAARMHCCVLRPALVYGPGVKGNLRRMIDAVAAGRFPPIPDFGNRRSMVGVDDLVAAARLAMAHDAARGKCYLVADGIDYSSAAMYLAIRRALGLGEPRWRLPRAALHAGARLGDLLSAALGSPMPLSSAVLSRLAGSACYRADRIRNELGWSPAQSFYSTLPAMCRGVARTQ